MTNTVNTFDPIRLFSSYPDYICEAISLYYPLPIEWLRKYRDILKWGGIVNQEVHINHPDSSMYTTVLSSLWRVDDSSTSLLMKEFYKSREANQSKAHALQSAQVALLKGILVSEEGYDFTHPFFWAPFVLIGNGS